MKILVVGGAGYIGSHMAKLLSKSGHDVIVLDNLSTGFRRLAIYGDLVVGNLGDQVLLDKLFKAHDFDAVMHFGAASLVGESVVDPKKYYLNNVSETIVLLDAMVRHDVDKFIFSSTAATYGEPEYSPIDEAHPKKPINPYGTSKLMVERILQDFAYAYDISSVTLRYFNACGADPDGELGECHEPETHLIPLILQAASGRRGEIKVFGRDYDTPDGTCVRDYIHVNDLCSAHRLALEYLFNNQPKSQAHTFNLGNGVGFSVDEVIKAASVIVQQDGKTIQVADAPRRQGDPARLVADSSKAKSVLGWVPKYTQIDEIIAHAWAWEKKQL